MYSPRYARRVVTSIDGEINAVYDAYVRTSTCLYQCASMCVCVCVRVCVCVLLVRTCHSPNSNSIVCGREQTNLSVRLPFLLALSVTRVYHWNVNWNGTSDARVIVYRLTNPRIDNEKEKKKEKEDGEGRARIAC